MWQITVNKHTQELNKGRLWIDWGINQFTSQVEKGRSTLLIDQRLAKGSRHLLTLELVTTNDPSYLRHGNENIQNILLWNLFDFKSRISTRGDYSNMYFQNMTDQRANTLMLAYLANRTECMIHRPLKILHLERHFWGPHFRSAVCSRSADFF